MKKKIVYINTISDAHKSVFFIIIFSLFTLICAFIALVRLLSTDWKLYRVESNREKKTC